MNIKKNENTLVFETSIPVFSWYIAKIMGTGFLIVLAIFGLTIASVLSSGGKFSSLTPDIYFAFGFFSLIFFLTYIVMAVIFPKGFISKIQISKKGVSQVSLSSTGKINRAAIIGGILTKSPGAVGTGLLAEAGDNRFLSWKEMGIVKVNGKSGYMYFSKGRLGLFPVGFFCPKEQYKKTLGLITKYFPNFQLEK